MAFYKGSAPRATFIDKIVQLLTQVPSGSLEPFWKQVQSGTYANEGFVLQSSGSSGTDKILIHLKQEYQDSITVSMMEDYVPNPVAGLVGTITNENTRIRQYWASGNYDANAPIYYWLSFDKNKIMLRMSGDKILSNKWKTFIWIGLPQRLSTENDSTAVGFLSTYSENGQLTSAGNGAISACRVLRDTKKVAQPVYNIKTLTSFGRTKGWGNKMMLPDLYLQHNNNDEGVRSRIDSVHPLWLDPAGLDFKDGDEITVGSKRYTIFDMTPPTIWQNSFPSYWLAVEQIV